MEASTLDHQELPRTTVQTTISAISTHRADITVLGVLDSGQLPAYRFGRVFRLQGREIDAFIDSARIQPGDLRHLCDTDEVGTEGEDPDDALGADGDAADGE
jgi:hypothetical protein